MQWFTCQSVIFKIYPITYWFSHHVVLDWLQSFPSNDDASDGIFLYFAFCTLCYGNIAREVGTMTCSNQITSRIRYSAGSNVLVMPLKSLKYGEPRDDKHPARSRFEPNTNVTSNSHSCSGYFRVRQNLITICNTFQFYCNFFVIYTRQICFACVGHDSVFWWKLKHENHWYHL